VTRRSRTTGRLIQQVDSSGTVDVDYDDRGLPESMSSTLAGDVDFTFDTVGRLSTVDYGGNTRRTLTYDPWGQVDTDVLATTGTATPLYGLDYGYDLDGNVTSKAVTGTGVPAAGTNAYTYDQASRITSWTRPGSSVAESYTWDKAGNRTTAGAGTAQYDPQNRLTTLTGADGSITSTWNANGTLDQQDVQPATRKVSLVVANPSSLTAADTALRDHFVAKGATVTLVDDAAAAPTTNVDVIVVSPGVDAPTLAAKYKDVATPVVMLASGAWQASGLTSGAPTTASGTSAYVADAIHPVAAGKTGTVAVLTSSDTLARAAAGTVGTGARRVWAASSGSTDGVVTAYETGAARPTSPASASPARRVAVGYSAGAVGKLNTDGWAVVDAAVAWADDNPLVPVAGVTSFDFDAFEQLRTVTPPSPATASTYAYDALGRRAVPPRVR
jgi:YD repeat-containing protein